MKKKIRSGMMMAVIVVGMLSLVFHMATGSSLTRVYVDPPRVVDPTLTVGSSFTVDIKVSDVEAEFGCYSWQVDMTFDFNILRCSSIAEGDFLKDQPEGTVFVYRIEEGWALFFAGTLGKHVGVNGSGTLATVEFLIVGTGESDIDIDHPSPFGTWLLEAVPLPEGGVEFREIPCLLENGYFSNLGALVISGTVDVDPNTINCKSKGRWITAYIELPEDYEPNDIDVNSVMLNHTIPVDIKTPAAIGDYDSDGISDLMVKFDRAAVIKWLGAIDYPNNTGKSSPVTVQVTGQVAGTAFEGSDKIKVLF
jgi:hypothetical protein